MENKQWETKQLDEAASFYSGGTPSKQEADYWEGDYPWVSAKDMKSFSIKDAELKLTPQGFAIAKIAPKGSVLVLVRGMTLLKDLPVGYVEREIAFNQDIKALVSKSGVSGLFLAYSLIANKNRILNLVNVSGHGTGRLDTTLLKEFSLDFPPLPEQRKIAEILSSWDKAIAILEQLINAKLKLKQGLMQQLLTGKKRFKEFEALGDKWKTTSFNQIIDKCFDYRGRTPLKIGMEWGNGKIPALSASNVRMGKIDFDRECYLGSNKLYKKWMTQGNVEKGDVLLTTEAPLGNVAQIPDNELYILSQRVILIRPKTNLLDKSFLFHLMTSQEFQGELDRNSSGSTAKGIQRKRLEKIVIAIPSLKEQHKIASILSTANAEISNLEKQLAAYKQQKRGLMQQLLTGEKPVKIEADVTV